MKISEMYELSWKKDAIFMGASLLGAGYYFMVDPAKSMMNQAEIEALDPADVNRFDRGATGNWSEQAHALSDNLFKILDRCALKVGQRVTYCQPP